MVAASALGAAVLGIACSGDDGPEPTPIALGEKATLAPGASLIADGVTVTFVRVERDSRCATDVTCVRAGEAFVVLVLQSGGESHEVSLEMPPQGEVRQTVAGVKFRVQQGREMTLKGFDGPVVPLEAGQAG